MTLITIGLVHKGAKDETITYIHIGIILLFLTLIINQLSVWKIRRENEFIYFSNFFGLNVKKMIEKENYKSIEGYVSFHPYRESETGKHLILITDKGKIKFNSQDYKDFNEVLDTIFKERTDLKIDFKNQIKNYQKKPIDGTWIYYSVSLLILLIIYLRNRYF